MQRASNIQVKRTTLSATCVQRSNRLLGAPVQEPICSLESHLEFEESKMSYQIVYWPGFTGRAEPAMLLLEDAGEAYEIVTDVRERIESLSREQPVFACPILIDGDTVVGQTNVILEYLGGKHGYDVQDSQRVAGAQLAYNVADIWRETYYGKKEGNTSYLEDRFPRWVDVLENSFASNSPDGFLLSDTHPTYLDFLTLNIVTLAGYCWGPAATAQIPAQPRLGQWVERMCARPRIQAYFENPSSLPVGHAAVQADS